MKVSINRRRSVSVNGKSHHSTGTDLFVPIDGEGLHKPPTKQIEKCIKCKLPISGTRIRNNNGIYHPRCYYEVSKCPTRNVIHAVITRR